MNDYQKLQERYRQIANLNDIRSIASWDEAVIMPAGSSTARNQAMADLSVVIQNLASHPEIGDWLASTESHIYSLDDWQKVNLKEMRRQFVLNTAVPKELNQKLVLARMHCEQQWRNLRKENHWSAFAPLLNEVIVLTREVQSYIATANGENLYDSALRLYSNGLSVDSVESLFDEIKAFLPSLIDEVIEKQKSEKVLVPVGPFSMNQQKALGLELMKLIGFNMEKGRLDESHHPFCGGTSQDVRITTRYNENEFISSLMGVLHETGHALYEQNLPNEWVGQPVGVAAGMAIHESQSLFMEMQVCRSREFLRFATPLIKKHIGAEPKNMNALNSENLNLLVTRVRRSYIRVDADEVTYPAHVILRFEIERDLLEGKLSTKDLPEVWNEKMQKYLGLSTLGNDRDGCMQDVHWPSGAFGYFPAYTFGAVIAAQLFSAVEKEIPEVRAQIAQGNFEPLQSWLNKKIWSQGSRWNTTELVKYATGEPLSAKAFRQHLLRRYLNRDQ